jgi:hypothetical protein
MLPLTQMRTSFSTEAGGGVRGKGDGIVRRTIIQIGATIEASLLFMEGYPQVGGMTTGSIVGEGISGTINEFLMRKFNRTGGVGKRISIGRSNILGVSRV